MNTFMFGSGPSGRMTLAATTHMKMATLIGMRVTLIDDEVGTLCQDKLLGYNRVTLCLPGEPGIGIPDDWIVHVTPNHFDRAIEISDSVLCVWDGIDKVVKDRYISASKKTLCHIALITRTKVELAREGSKPYAVYVGEDREKGRTFGNAFYVLAYGGKNHRDRLTRQFIDEDVDVMRALDDIYTMYIQNNRIVIACDSLEVGENVCAALRAYIRRELTGKSTPS